MKKFVVHSIKGVTSIMEVECRVVTALQDPSVMFIPAGEYKAEILNPVALYEKQSDGSLRSPVYYSHSLHETVEAAMVAAKKGLEESYRRTCHKCNMDVDGQTLEEILAKITTVTL